MNITLHSKEAPIQTVNDVVRLEYLQVFTIVRMQRTRATKLAALEQGTFW